MSTGALDPKSANILYHDRAAIDYDQKWSIQYDERTLAYAEERMLAVLASRRRFERALEVGSGTGFFLLHLWKGGWVEHGTATDISPRILDVCAKNARDMGWQIDTEVADAERLPFEDDSFDLVCGHAFLHHIPEPAKCVREMARVCRPGGVVLIAGEPTRVGHEIAEATKAVTRAGLRVFALTPFGRDFRPAEKTDDERETEALEKLVDIWEFDPERVAGMFEGAGLTNVRYETEEFFASLVAWFNKTVEGSAPPGVLGSRWAWFAYRNYQRFARLDEIGALERVVPDGWYYNIVIAGEKPD